jgi:hypothetical protein
LYQEVRITEEFGANIRHLFELEWVELVEEEVGEVL